MKHGGEDVHVDQGITHQAEKKRKRRDNRAEIVKARSIGQITRRDLFRWGIFTSSGLLVCKNGLSPLARSAFAQSHRHAAQPPVRCQEV